jgi:hypothetical protein
MASDDDTRDLEAAITKHYARDQEGLPPPVAPFGGKYATNQEAWVAHRRWLSEGLRSGRLPVRTPPAVLPDPPSQE